ncbi:MAG: ABC transporter ATP-binding protein [Acidobacteria bacterium]|nr:MAG: ABC transporter ATP-binding protein [Acidobacteriota bacterium]REK04341.1 MAG: ABC transporter ATP-binding protein [Acidobacteriota bacterium]
MSETGAGGAAAPHAAAAGQSTSRQEGGAVRARSLDKSYRLGGEEVVVLRGADLDLAAGEAVAVIGPSGSGKSTLLHILGTLERPDAGSVEIDGVDLSSLEGERLSRFRSDRVGFVFQDHHLLPQYGVLQNVLMPTLAHPGAVGTRQRAEQLLGAVGLAHRLDHRPAQLSGGERQRAAIARALINRPSLLLCDEPTGNLDGATADVVGDLLFELHRREGGTMVVVTHSLDLAGRFPRTLRLDKGQLREAS